MNHYEQVRRRKTQRVKKNKRNGITPHLEELNISESTYFRMEKGETASWTSKIDQICKLYQIEPEELLLSKEKYIKISDFEQSGSGTINGIVNNSYDKVSEFFEGIIKQKNEVVIRANALKT